MGTKWTTRRIRTATARATVAVAANPGERRVSGILIAMERRTSSPEQRNSGWVPQHPAGPYVVDFAWPNLKVALEADGGVHGLDARYRRDRLRDAWLREHGWLVFRVDTTLADGLADQVGRVVAVVRAISQA